eukprot:gene19248-19635_t
MKIRPLAYLLGALALFQFGFGAASFAAANEFSPKQKDEIAGIIKDYLVQHPEVLREALNALAKQEKDAEQSAQDNFTHDMSGALYASTHQAIVGNPDGKTVLVEFFDYNCGYCKRSIDDIANLIKQDPNLKVILKDFPVLGPGSIEASKVASAVRNQLTGDKFWDFHRTLLLSHGPVGKAQALEVARAKNVDMNRLATDMASADINAGISEVMVMGDKLGLTGTPSFVVGGEVVIGAVGYDKLREKVTNTET